MGNPPNEADYGSRRTFRAVPPPGFQLFRVPA